MKINRNEKKDLEKLSQAFFKNLQIDDCEFGGIGLDSKRPFGNSNVCEDILEIIEWKPEGNDDVDYRYSPSQLEYAYFLYHEKLIPYLQKKYLKEK